MTFEGAITAVGNIVPNTMDAIGRLFPGVPLGSVDRAKSRSVKRTLRDMEIVKNIGAEKEMSQESIDALCSAIAKERVGCERLSNVVSFAAELEPDVSRADEVDPAWVEAFRRHAERAVDEEAQRTWASVLAGELDSPGSVSKKTMSILGDMSRSEARAFQKLCGCSIEAVDPDGGKKLLPMIECKGLEEFSLSRDEAESLDALGLTKIHSKGVYVYGSLPFDQRGILVAKIDGVAYRLDRREHQVAVVTPDLTRYGRELAALCAPGSYPGFRDAVIQWLESTGVCVEEID